MQKILQNVQFEVRQVYFTSLLFAVRTSTTGGGGEGVLPYISQNGMCRPKRVGFLIRFGLKTGIDFAHFGLELGMVFEGTTGVYERMYGFNCK